MIPKLSYPQDYVLKTDQCWLWLGPANRKGYGMISRKVYFPEQYVHRISFINNHGPIKPGNQVLHKCDNPNCFKPSHLTQGTNQENQIDSVRKGRHWKIRNTTCPKGHPYSGENLYVCKKNIRYCKICKLEATRAWRKELKNEI